MIYGRGKVNIQKIQKMGLLAVKIGQVHALRLDFLPIEKCSELAKLFGANIPVPTEEVLEQINPTPFKHIDKKPLATASVGQVHRAQLKDGTEVVIKVIKKDFQERFSKDVQSIKKLFKWIIFIYPKLRKVFDPIGILEHIEEYTLRELNLLNEIEGHNILLRIYEENKEKYDLSKLAFPKIYRELSNETVMVSEFVDGKTFDELLDKELPYEILLELFHVHGFYIFNIGTFHGDIHAGNIMYSKGKIVFVDTGAIGEVSTKIQQGLFRFFDALSLYHYDEAAKYLNEMAEVGIEGKKFEKFKEKFKALYEEFTNTTVSQVSLTKKMMQTIKLGVNSGMEFEKGMFSIIKSMMFLDGMVIRNNPDAILLKDMRQFIDQLNDYQSKNKG
jgi:ubiquinone biosynthesis protein